MACMLSVRYTLLIVYIVLRQCQAEEEGIYLREKQQIHKLIKNNFDEVGVESKMLNLTAKNLKDQDIKLNSQMNDNTLNGKKISHTLETETSGYISVNHDKNKNMMMNVESNELLSSNEKMYDDISNHITENIHGNNNANRNTVHRDKMNNEHISSVAKDPPRVTQRKFVIAHKREHLNNHNNIWPHAHSIEAEITAHDKTWNFNEAKESENESVDSKMLMSANYKNNPLKNKRINKQCQEREIFIDRNMGREDINKDHINTKLNNISSKKINSDINLKAGDKSKLSVSSSNTAEPYLLNPLNKQKGYILRNEDYLKSGTNKLHSPIKYKLSKMKVDSDRNSLNNAHHNKQMIRNERATNKRHNTMEFHDKGKDLKGSCDIEHIYPDDRGLGYKYGRRYMLNHLNHESLENSPDDYHETVLFKRPHLSRLNREESKECSNALNTHETTFSQDTTAKPTTSSCATVQSKPRETSQKCGNDHEATDKPNVVTDRINKPQMECKEYDHFLSGQLVDEFVKAVFKKVARSKKIMLELGFSNNTDESCDRCAELKDRNIPDLKDMKQSMEMLATQDKFKCYKVPPSMGNYLSILLSNKLENTSSAYKNDEEENFIFTEDYFDSSQVDNEMESANNYGSKDPLAKDYLEKRLKEDIHEGKSDDQTNNTHAKNLSKLPVHTNKYAVQDEDKGFESKPNKSRKSYQQSKGRKRDSFHKIEIQSINPEKKKYSPSKNPHIIQFEQTDQDSNNDFYNVREGYLGSNLNRIKESEHPFDNKIISNQYEKVDTDNREYKKKGVRRSEYGEEFTNVQIKSDSYGRPWGSSIRKDGKIKNKGDTIINIAGDVLQRRPMQEKRNNEKNKEGNHINLPSNEYAEDEEHVKNPQTSLNDWNNVDFQRYTKQKGLDLYDSPMDMFNIWRDYDSRTRILKRDTQPPHESYQDDNSIIYEVPDIEYDLY